MMNRSLLLVALASSVFYMVAPDQQNSVTLNPVIIGLVDGLPFGINGELVGAIYKMARDIQALQSGRRTENGRVGMFTFQGKAHTIRTLAELEISIAHELQTADEAQRRQLLAKQKAINEILKEAKQNFATIVGPFIAHARGAKEPMFMLISESCSKRDRINSLLFNWAKSNEDEMVSFDKSVTSFVLFDEFCTDLVNFLGDMVQNCPKARGQFEKLKQEYVRQHTSHVK